MRLTKFSDYALRVLLYAASIEDGRLVTIGETAAVYGISQGHLKKVVMNLIHAGFLQGTRGRTGGFRLARPPGEIRLGEVLRATETDFALVECFQKDGICCISRPCQLPPIIAKAVKSFMSTLDDYTVADVVMSPDQFGLAEAARERA